MAKVGTHTVNGHQLAIVGIPGVDDNDVVIELVDASPYSEFFIFSTAGVLEVDVSLDGTNFDQIIALTNEKSTTPATKVLITVADGLYSFRGQYRVVRVRQASATAVANASMICGRR